MTQLRVLRTSTPWPLDVELGFGFWIAMNLTVQGSWFRVRSINRDRKRIIHMGRALVGLSILGPKP